MKTNTALAINYDCEINNAFEQSAIPVIKEQRFKNNDMALKNLASHVIPHFSKAE